MAVCPQFSLPQFALHPAMYNMRYMPLMAASALLASAKTCDPDTLSVGSVFKSSAQEPKDRRPANEHIYIRLFFIFLMLIFYLKCYIDTERNGSDWYVSVVGSSREVILRVHTFQMVEQYEVVSSRCKAYIFEFQFFCQFNWQRIS